MRHSVELGRSLGLRVVAEGVQSAAVRDHLAAMGCDRGQGFFYSRALPNTEFAAWLERAEGQRGPGTDAGRAAVVSREAAGWASAA